MCGRSISKNGDDGSILTMLCDHSFQVSLSICDPDFFHADLLNGGWNFGNNIDDLQLGSSVFGEVDRSREGTNLGIGMIKAYEYVLEHWLPTSC